MPLKTLSTLINQLHALPGISKKQAEKIAFYMVKPDVNISKTLVEAINDANKNIDKCNICHHLMENNTCLICNDKERQNILIIVESSLDVFKFEDDADFNGFYHVLGGLINISKNIEFKMLNIENLIERAKQAKEIIIALSPNLEGIVTANYLKEILQGMKVTQLAQGIPLGAAMEYVDKFTLKEAFKNRKDLK